jgi:tetratricopeptide (TPR) repeat protein
MKKADAAVARVNLLQKSQSVLVGARVIGKAVHGLADVDRVLAVKGNDADILDTRGMLLEDIGRRAEAVESFRAALAIDPTLQHSKDALKRLDARESKWQEWQERLIAWRDAVGAWARDQWEGPNKARWIWPALIFLMMVFGGKSRAPGGAQQEEGTSSPSIERNKPERLKRVAWWGGLVALIATLAWATR